MGLGIKKGDIVKVIAGKEKGKQGRVLFVARDKSKVTIEKVNIIKKHMKPSRKQTQGGIIDKEGAVHLSNVMLVCPKCGRRTRLGARVMDDGGKSRVCKKCGEVID